MRLRLEFAILKDGKPEKFDELKDLLVTKADTGFRGLRQGSSLIIACNGEKKLFRVC